MNTLSGADASSPSVRLSPTKTILCGNHPGHPVTAVPRISGIGLLPEASMELIPVTRAQPPTFGGVGPSYSTFTDPPPFSIRSQPSPISATRPDAFTRRPTLYRVVASGSPGLLPNEPPARSGIRM